MLSGLQMTTFIVFGIVIMAFCIWQFRFLIFGRKGGVTGGDQGLEERVCNLRAGGGLRTGQRYSGAGESFMMQPVSSLNALK